MEFFIYLNLNTKKYAQEALNTYFKVFKEYRAVTSQDLKVNFVLLFFSSTTHTMWYLCFFHFVPVLNSVPR